ncbi:MAG TPA: cytochrome b N-terminal domain-containing protein [Myxococcota bacterium]|nr:cytochrome b N-terminal domain-containing protein [Myxococcota bacterium]
MLSPRNLAQGAFLRADALLNRLLGERMNPLYHLGAIAYFQLWIVVASGLYLYAFFETSVTGAYASVEALTHSQAWAGGILRSLHRYASDGMVLAMVLHLVRHFTFGHHRGFRWFSWVSGVALLWMVYVSGINGYMLPWDRLAQFVVVSSTEWLDVLPLFDGRLARNFLYAGSVNDRLFSLLSFLHIGLPLGVLALLWVHTQRVPKARTQPPRGITFGVSAMLLALSVVKPAVSHAPADLALVPQTLALDWFYLPMLPLIYEWGIVQTWWLVAGATLLLFAAPWLGRRARAGELAVSVHPDERILTVRRGETILEAGLRDGLPMPFECRNGGCGECKGDLLAGEVRLRPYQEEMLTDAERAAGRTLFCCAEPVSDVEISYQPAAGAPPAPVRRYGARVIALERLAPEVMKVVLRVEEGGRLRWHAGQYLNVILEDGAKRSFSFATAPRAGPDIELHIRRIEGGRFTTHVFEAMRARDLLRFEGPLGAFHLREEGDKPILFVAGSTGFAPVKSMLEHAFATGVKRPMVLYWGVRRREDLYAEELVAGWARDHPDFTFVPVLSEPQPGDGWTGRTGLVHEAILADYPDLSQHQVYACGSVQMVEAVAPALAAQGLSPDDCFSDAFRLAPHARTPEAEMVRLGGRP